MIFSERVIKAIEEKNSVLIVGLDPNVDYFPDFLIKGCKTNKDFGKAIYQFNKIVIDNIKEDCAIIKPQLAYYEVYGSEGIVALEKTIAYAKQNGLIIINDAKRGDIGTTCDAYAKAFLGDGPLSADAVTVNPYLGRDGILPFTNIANSNDNGLFVLVKTSNPSSGDLQDLVVDRQPLYEKTAHLIAEISETMPRYKNYNSCGVVVGATYPKMAEDIRKLLPHCFFLVPGYGAQGGSGKDLLSYFDDNGLGALVSSSRGITYAYQKEYNKKDITLEQLASSIAKATKEAKEDINQYRFK